MADWNPKANELFLSAVEIVSPVERETFLERACAGDALLRRQVESLLAASMKAGSFLERPAGGFAPTVFEPASFEHSGAVVGRYKLLEQIGEGGFGIVYRAEQTEPVRRQVALKILKPGMDTRQVVARFEAERQALALMDHPHIARVFDGGMTPSGRPYFVMELVAGVPITEFCDQHLLATRERLELFVSVCQAVQHAHQKGIIHRDIKPSNVLVTMSDGRPVPKVIDFGVAKAINQQLRPDTIFTGFGELIGTPLYMSPEQADMTSLDVDTRSDIYSLGVLLYELLTGCTPFDRERLKQAGFDEIRRIVREEEPARPSVRLSSQDKSGSQSRFGVARARGSATLVSIAALRHTEPRKLCQLMRGELDWIVMKCLDKDRNRRYATASDLLADVRRYLSDEAVQACPPSSMYRLKKLARRNKAALATASVVGLAVFLTVAALATSTVVIGREQRATSSALINETRAKHDLEQTLQRAQQEAYFHRITLAHRDLSADNLGRALQLLDECPPALRRWEWYYLRRLCRVEPVVLRDNTEINGLALSPDGEFLASAGGDGTVKVWNSRTGQAFQTLPTHAGFVSCVAFHADGKHLASTGEDRLVNVWNLSTGKRVFSSPCEIVHKNGAGYTAAFSPDGRRLAAGSDGTVTIWDWKNAEILQAFAGHGKNAIGVAFSHDGRRVASGSWWGSIQLWDAEAGGEPLCTFPESRNVRHPVCGVAFSPDGGRLATASFGRRVNVWDTASGELLHTLRHSGLVLCVTFSPDGRRIVSSGEDKVVHVWDATTGREVLSLRGHSGWCGCVSFSPDGWRLASGSADGTIRIWDATPLVGHEGDEVLNFAQHTDEVWSLAVSPDGQKIVSAGWSLPVKVWNSQTGTVTAEFNGHRDVVFGVTWHSDGARIATAGRDAELFTVKVWDARTGQEGFQLPLGPEYFTAVFSPDGRYLVTGRSKGSVQVWDARTGQPIVTLGTHKGPVRGIAFSREGSHMASASSDGVLKLWDATRLTEEQEARLTLDARVPGPCANLAFSPNGRRLVTGIEDCALRIWDTKTGQELRTLRGHSGDAYTVAFSTDDDGRWIASAGEDSTVRIWDSQSGKPVHTFRGHIGLVSCVAFTPDGRRLVSGSRDHTVKVWDLAPLKDRIDR